MNHDWFERMLADAADTFYVSTDEILSSSRYGNPIDARHCVAWACRAEGLSLQAIGARLSRDHSTILSAVRRVDRTPGLLKIAQGLYARHPRTSRRVVA